MSIDCIYDCESLTNMAHIGSDVCEMQLNGVSEVMDLLFIDVETDTTVKPLQACFVFQGSSLTDYYFRKKTLLTLLYGDCLVG